MVRWGRADRGQPWPGVITEPEWLGGCGGGFWETVGPCLGVSRKPLALGLGFFLGEMGTFCRLLFPARCKDQRLSLGTILPSGRRNRSGKWMSSLRARCAQTWAGTTWTAGPSCSFLRGAPGVHKLSHVLSVNCLSGLGLPERLRPLAPRPGPGRVSAAHTPLDFHPRGGAWLELDF